MPRRCACSSCFAHSNRLQERPSAHSSLGIRCKTAPIRSLFHLKPVLPATLRFVAAYVALGLVVRETCHCSTSAKPSHGLSPPDWQSPFARSPLCVRPPPAGIEQGAPLALPGSAQLPLDSASSGAVSMAYLPEVWLWILGPSLDDEWLNDVPALPPELHEDFCSIGRRRGPVTSPFSTPLPRTVLAPLHAHGSPVSHLLSPVF
jgi:hypothetical protein